MAIIDINGTYQGLPAPNTYLVFKYFQGDRSFPKKTDEEGNFVGIDKKIKVVGIFSRYHSKASFEAGDDPLSEVERVYVDDQDFVKNIISGQSIGQIFYEKAMVSEMFTGCIADIEKS